jgi:3-phosphoshikimate 1-carboxyvinyltransferase
MVCGEEVADILVEKSTLSPVRITKTEVPSMIDELPLVALLCAFAKGESEISGAQELKYKECDRILATAELINSLGGVCIPTTDGFMIKGFGGLDGGAVESYGDHRIAMTGAIALLASKNGGELYGDKYCAISFPDFFEKLGV